MLDIKQIRQNTPGCHDKVFLNSASSSLMTKTATDKMTAYLLEEQMHGGYKAAQAHAEAIEDFYNQAALLLNCKPANIAFSYNATDAYAKALSSITFRHGDVIITTDYDYLSNQLAFLSLKKRYGIEVIRAKTQIDNSLDINNFEDLIIRHKPALVAVTHVPTNSGLIQDVEAVGALCDQYDVLYLVDACQSVGQMVVDVQKIKCDFITATGRKFLRGPRGTGILYVSDKVLQQNLLPLLPDACGAAWVDFEHFTINNTARRFELFDRSFMSLVGLADSLAYINMIGIGDIAEYNRQLARQLRTLLSQNQKVRVLDKGSELSNIITIQALEKSIGDLEQILREQKIYYSVSRLNVAPVEKLQSEEEYAIRLSPHYFNTPEEIQFVAGILELV